MPDSYFYGILYKKHVCEVSEVSDNFKIGGISYLGSYWPFITQKGFFSVFGLHGTQVDLLELTVSMQKSVLKNIHQVQRY